MLKRVGTSNCRPSKRSWLSAKEGDWQKSVAWRLAVKRNGGESKNKTALRLSKHNRTFIRKSRAEQRGGGKKNQRPGVKN